MEYFRKLLELVRLEQEEDYEAFQKASAGASVQERRLNGMTWYPVAIRSQELGRGDYLTVELERTTHHDIAHLFQAGKPAALFSNHNPGHDRVRGVIRYQGGNRLRLTLESDELPDWAGQGKLGIDLLFDNESYDTMKAALKAAMEPSGAGASGRLVRVLTGETAPAFTRLADPPVFPELNASQHEAVRKIIEAQDLAIVHGPPGTGKTTTLVAAISHLARNGTRPVLVVAPSNAAVDYLCEKLSGAALRVVRIGNPVRVSENLLALTLDERMAAHPAAKSIRGLRKKASEYRDMAHRYKRHFGPSEREQRRALFNEAHKILREAADLERYVVTDELERADVIAATPVGADNHLVRTMTFGTVVIDEAGQALEPACWIPVIRAGRVIMAGDHYQLPPTVKSQEAAKRGLSITLMEKCVRHHPESVVLLNEQYRMHAKIMGYSSDVFYGGKLQAHASVADRTVVPGDNPLLFIDTAGCGFEEEISGTSAFNTGEAALMIQHLSGYLREVSAAGACPSVGVISPYKQQVQVLKEMAEGHTDFEKWRPRLSVNTIDSFQGQERDVIYISLVRSNSKGETGFLADTRRMNVAMTRARMKLVVIGDSATLAGDPFYLKFIEYATQHEAYMSAWELTS